MKGDERRFHRLNHLLQLYLKTPNDEELFKRAKLMGVSDSTARDYMRTVIIRAKKMQSMTS